MEKGDRQMIAQSSATETDLKSVGHSHRRWIGAVDSEDSTVTSPRKGCRKKKGELEHVKGSGSGFWLDS